MSQSAVAGVPSRGQFLEEFLVPGRPLVARGALGSWPAAPPWGLAELTRRFGDAPVPVFDTLFSLQRVSRFADYIAAHTGAAVTGVPPYLRWFTRYSRERLPWADEAFAEFADEWSMPSWLPDSGYLFPLTRGPVDAARNAFPARGLFVCGTDGRTRLHVDPWASDACLCQVTGSKRFMLFPPAEGALLSDATAIVDLDHPDERRFPLWRQAVPVIDEVLHPGDAIFIPAGWYHTAVAQSDSVSITWNFVHRVHEGRFGAYLRSGGRADPVVSYFRTLADPAA
jgi:Cupin-like domain